MCGFYVYGESTEVGNLQVCGWGEAVDCGNYMELVQMKGGSVLSP